MRKNKQKTSINISDIIECNLKQNHQILITFHSIDAAGYQTTVQVPASPNVCFCATEEKQSRQNMHQNEQKVNKIFYLQICRPQMSVEYKVCHLAVCLPKNIKNVHESKKRLAKSSWIMDWSGAEHY